MTLETFAPTPTVVTIKGGTEKIAVKPITIGQVPAMVAPARALFARLQPGATLETVIIEGLNDALDVVEVATGLEHSVIEDLAPDEFAELFKAVWTVNVDFFVRRGMPALNALAAEIGKTLSPTDGPGPSPTSQDAGTASQTPES